MRRTTLALVLLAATTVAAAPLRTGTAAPAPPGPGAVLHMHVRLFAALDRGDCEAVVATLAPDEEEGGVERRAHLFLGDDGERVLAATGEADARELLAAWCAGWREGRGKVKTEILSHQTECTSGDLSYGIFEIARDYERDGERLRDRLRVTSLVAYRGGGWKLFHVHASPVAIGEPAPPADRRIR